MRRSPATREEGRHATGGRAPELSSPVARQGGGRRAASSLGRGAGGGEEREWTGREGAGVKKGDKKSDRWGPRLVVGIERDIENERVQRN